MCVHAPGPRPPLAASTAARYEEANEQRLPKSCILASPATSHAASRAEHLLHTSAATSYWVQEQTKLMHQANQAAATAGLWMTAQLVGERTNNPIASVAVAVVVAAAVVVAVAVAGGAAVARWAWWAGAAAVRGQAAR
eukprot:1152423-Pelagomonas_calceolata.AAC.2